jgi:hypothetical protein
MGRVWLGATHGSRPPGVGAATAEVVGPPVADRGARVPCGPGADPAVLPRTARRPHRRDEPAGSPLDRRYRWTRWFRTA